MVEMFYSNLENLVLPLSELKAALRAGSRAMSEMIGSAIDQTCTWFQVSGSTLALTSASQIEKVVT